MYFIFFIKIKILQFQFQLLKISISLIDFPIIYVIHMKIKNFII